MRRRLGYCAGRGNVAAQSKRQSAGRLVVLESGRFWARLKTILRRHNGLNYYADARLMWGYRSGNVALGPIGGRFGRHCAREGVGGFGFHPADRFRQDHNVETAVGFEIDLLK